MKDIFVATKSNSTVRLACCALLTIPFIVNNYAKADILGIAEFNTNGSLMGRGNSVVLEVDLTDAASSFTGPATFTTILVDGEPGFADIDPVRPEYVLNAGDEFDRAVEQLTNGTNDAFRQSVTMIAPAASTFVLSPHVESTSFAFFGSAGENGIDFQGATIESITLRVNIVEMSPVPGQANFSQGYLYWDLIVKGTVPSPSALPAMGIVGFVTLRRRR